MMRTLFSALFALIVYLFTFVVLPLLLIVLASAILLGAGSLLTRFFAVNVFEATLILTVVAIPIMWLILRLFGFLNVVSVPVEDEEPPEPPSVAERWIQVPRGAARRGKRR